MWALGVVASLIKALKTQKVGGIQYVEKRDSKKHIIVTTCMRGGKMKK